MRFVDLSRNDPYVRANNRELLIQLWYPASTVQGYHLVDYSSPKVWRYISQLTGVDLPPISTNSVQNAPIVAGPHPLVLLTHGYTGTLTDYTFLAEDLASRGYVVASVAHTYESTAVEFPDGRLVLSVLGSHFRVDALRTDEQTISFAAHVREQDISSVLDELQRRNATSGDFLASHLDFRRVAVMGHSLGGIAALAIVSRDPRISAAIVMDAPASANSATGTGKPVLILAAGRDQWGARDCQLWRNLRGPRLLVGLDVALLGAYLLVAMTPIMTPIGEHWMRVDSLPADTLDAVIALSAGVKSDSALNAVAADRLIGALELMRQGHGRRLVTTRQRDVKGRRTIDSDTDQRRLISLASLEGTWTVVDSVHTTREEAVRSAAVLLPAGARSIIVITSPMHTRRACAVFEGVGFRVVCRPARERDFVTNHPAGNRDRLAALRAYGYEVMGMVKYRAKGWLTPHPPVTTGPGGSS